MTGCPKVGDWVVVLPGTWSAGRIMQVTAIPDYGRQDLLTQPVCCGPYGGWWVSQIRLASPEEIATHQLASLPGGQL